MTLTNITATIAVVATKDWYAEGYGECTVTIEPKKLVVDVHAEPSIILSEATSIVSVYVSCEGVPVLDADVTLSSSKGGNFSEVEKITDMNDTATFTFTAPITTANMTTTIVANATKYGYVSGEGQANITVIPRVLLVQVVADPVSINSEMTSNVTVRVTSDSDPISDVTVTLSSDNGGSFYPINGTTDANGECLFTFTSPQVTTPINITITATATKTGYADGTNRTTITVNLGTLDVQVTANPATVESEATSTVTVHVTYNAKPVANAVVTISGESGTFSVTTGITDENGDCTFTFTAPQTTTEFNVAITAIATKSGYINGQEQTKITVSPVAAPGLPLTTILMIAAVITVIAIVLVLIKLKIIVITWKEG
ncbi:MAG: Alpha-2-macroglobulin MG1 domain protein [Candidatus Bathyarchaeota archaeon BA2]|nr:MAG: Alpha-2-macroglobulin MG1 domain protein [Candidatus Bathyarchaeota archaeon BA2]